MAELEHRRRAAPRGRRARIQAHRAHWRLEADAEVREATLDRRQAELADLEERLSRRERELAAYVAQVQAQLAVRP